MSGKSRAKRVLFWCIAGVMVAGLGFAANSWLKDFAEHNDPLPAPDLAAGPDKPVPPGVVRRQFDWDIPNERLDRLRRLVFSPSAEEELEVRQELVAGILWEEQYTPIPLTDVEGMYTENQFQADRAEWYANDFVKEYERAGHRDPLWNDQVRAFLKAAGERVSITRYRRHRSPKFYPDNFDDQLIEQGRAILKAGCKDLLVMSLLVQELARAEQLVEARQLADELNRLADPSEYSQFVQYQIKRACLLGKNSQQHVELMAKHFVQALNRNDFTDLERRIYYEEAQNLYHPVHRPNLGKFIYWLEQYGNGDPWLKEMLVGDFYLMMALDANLLRQYWTAYDEQYRESVEGVRGVHLGHLRKAFRMYMEAYFRNHALPEAPVKLFQMSFSQEPAATDLPSEMNEGSLARLSPVSPRDWFDRAVAVQFDYRPAYRQYRAALLPQLWSGTTWPQYDRLLDFGQECLLTERFDTQVPFGYQDAVEATIRHDEYSIPPASPRNQEVYALDGVSEAMQQMVDGYKDHLSESQSSYYQTLLLGIRWLAGDRDEVAQPLADLGPSLDAQAFRDLYLDKMEMLREVELAEKPGNRITVEDILAAMPIADSHRALLVMANGRMRIWNLETFEQEQDITLMEHVDETPVRSTLADQGRFVACFHHNVVKVFETKTFSEVASLEFEQDLHSFAISPTGRILLASFGETVEFWDVNEQQRIGEIDIALEEGEYRDEAWKQHQQMVSNAAFSADEQFVAFVRGLTTAKFPQGTFWSPNGGQWPVSRLYLWDIGQAKLVASTQPFNPNITTLQFTHDDSELLVAGTEWSNVRRAENALPEIVEHHSVKRLSRETLEPTMTYAGRVYPFWSLTEVGPDHGQIVGTCDREMLVWDAATGDEVTSVEPFAKETLFMIPSQGSLTLDAVDVDGFVRPIAEDFHPGLRPVLADVDRYENYDPHTIRFHPETRRMAICNGHTGALIWDFTDPEQSTGRAYRLPGSVGTTALDVSSDFDRLAMIEDTLLGAVIREMKDATPISIWDTESGEVVRTLEGESSRALCARFDPTGQYLVAGLDDGNLAIWDLESDSTEPVRLVKEHVAAVTRLAFSPDGTFLLSGGQPGEELGVKSPACVKVWDVADLTNPHLVRTLDVVRQTPHPFGVQDIDVSADGERILATYGWQTSLYSFDGTLQCTVQGNKARFLPDNSAFVTAGGVELNKKVALWQPDGKLIREFEDETRRPIQSLVVMPGGEAVLAAPFSEAVGVWNIKDGTRAVRVSTHFQ